MEIAGYKPRVAVPCERAVEGPGQAVRKTASVRSFDRRRLAEDDTGKGHWRHPVHGIPF